MAKHGRKFRRYLAGAVDNEITLSTLGPATVISDPVDDTVIEEAFVSSVDATWSIKGYDQSQATAGPVSCGWAHSDYTSAEIEEWIESQGSWDQGDLRSQEIAKRKIKWVGTFEADIASGNLSIVTLNDGRPIKTKLRWMLSTGQTLRMWAYNTGAAALDTGSLVRAMGTAHIWPR